MWFSESVTLMPSGNTPLTVGVPESVNAGLSVRPGGNTPDTTAI